MQIKIGKEQKINLEEIERVRVIVQYHNGETLEEYRKIRNGWYGLIYIDNKEYIGPSMSDEGMIEMLTDKDTTFEKFENNILTVKLNLRWINP